MKRDDILPWAAGMVGANAEYQIGKNQGPTKEYIGFAIAIPCADDVEVERLIAVNHNGWKTERGFELAGYAAIRGFLQEVWKYLSPSSREVANNAIRFYKEQREALHNG